MVTIQPVKSAHERREFVEVSRRLYPRDSPWVRPLDGTVLGYLDARRCPFYRDGIGQAFLACRDGRTVGRVLAHVWRRHHRLHGEAAGYFGLFECADDPEAATALLDTAAAVARNAGCAVLRGPFNMTAAQEAGIVTGGFPAAPAVDMVYTPPSYPGLLEAAGLRVCFRMQTWRNDAIGGLDPEAMLSPQHRDLQARLGIRARPLASGRRGEEMEQIRELVNAAFLGNWSFVPITREEWELQVGELTPLLDPAIVPIAEVQGVPIGVTLAVPDFNQVLRRMNGRLLHPAAVSLLRARPADDAVVILFAVRKQFQGLGVSRLLNAELVRALQRRGYRGLSGTWIGAENAASQAQVTALGMRPLHELAIYERSV